MELRHCGGNSVRSGADSSTPTEAWASRQGRRGVGLTLSSYRLPRPCQQKNKTLREPFDHPFTRRIETRPVWEPERDQVPERWTLVWSISIIGWAHGFLRR